MFLGLMFVGLYDLIWYDVEMWPCYEFVWYWLFEREKSINQWF